MKEPDSRQYIAGIDIGGTNLRCAIADCANPSRPIVHRKTSTPVHEGSEAIAALIGRTIHGCLREAGVSSELLSAAGCATPGIVDSERGIVAMASNLQWTDVPLSDLLSSQLRVPVLVENDVRAAALAEFRFGAGQGCSSLVYFTVSTGVSAGVIADGRLIRGHHHASGEIAYFIPDPDHIGKDWGENGCLEQNSGGVGIARLWAAQQGGPSEPSAATRVFKLAREGDERATALVRRAADYLSQAAVAIGTLIDPEILVLGGSIAEHETFIVDRIQEVIQISLPYPFRVTQAALGGDAPLIGALSLAFEWVNTKSTRRTSSML